MKQTITIMEINDKVTTKGDKYIQIQTDKGKMSVFDTSLEPQIRGGLGKVCIVETTQSGIFTNLVGFESVQIDATPAVVPASQLDNAIGESAKAKRRAEMMTVAKDLVICSNQDMGLEGNADQRLSILLDSTKVVWRNLLDTIGEPYEDILLPEQAPTVDTVKQA